MHELPFSPSRLKLYSYHKWLGVTVFLPAIARLLWRLKHPVATTSKINAAIWGSSASPSPRSS